MASLDEKPEKCFLLDRPASIEFLVLESRTFRLFAVELSIIHIRRDTLKTSLRLRQ